MLIIQRPTIEALGDELNNRQSFGIGPLDPGFGHTLGNSLRRTLLSSIPGAAATRVKFDAVLHEFGVIEGVKEDVQDICLNLKDLLLQVHSDEPVMLRLDKRGEGPVTASDLSTTADVEILNGDLHLAYLTNAKSALTFELTVERGKGYVGAEGNKGSSTIGVIPLDAIFTPVRRVSFEIEPVRVEQSKDFDRLVIEIETDGSISPREALASAGKTLGFPGRADRQLRRRSAGSGVGRRRHGPGRGQRARHPHRRARPDRALPQLPQARRHQHHRAVGQRHRARPHVDHQLRCHLTEGRQRPPRRARPVAASRGLTMRGTPTKGKRFGGDSAHQKAMMGNLVASMIAAESIVTTEAKAKALRPIVEKVVTAAKNSPEGSVHANRRVVAFIRDKDMTHKLFTEIAPRYSDRPGGYTRILKLGPRQGDNAPMARIEFV